MVRRGPLKRFILTLISMFSHGLLGGVIAVVILRTALHILLGAAGTIEEAY